MRRISPLFVLVIILGSPFLILGQTRKLPKESQRLVERAQDFWSAVVAGQRIKAVAFVLPDKKDVYLSGAVPSIIAAKILGLDLTPNPERAVVRVELTVLAPEALAQQVVLTASDSWVWQGNNWFADAGGSHDLFAKDLKSPAQLEKENAESRRLIEAALVVLENSFDLGTIVQGTAPVIEIPVKYSGTMPLFVESGLPVDLLTVQSPKGGLTSESRGFGVSVNTSVWDGPFSIPLPVRFRYQGAIVQRTVTIRGNVFVPISFRQVPSPGIARDAPFSVFVRNNTSEPVPVQYISVDGKLDLISGDPKVLESQQEYELVFKFKTDRQPDRLYLMTAAPVFDRTEFIFEFRIGR